MRLYAPRITTDKVRYGLRPYASRFDAFHQRYAMPWLGLDDRRRPTARAACCPGRIGPISPCCENTRWCERGASTHFPINASCGDQSPDGPHRKRSMASRRMDISDHLVARRQSRKSVSRYTGAPHDSCPQGVRWPPT